MKGMEVGKTQQQRPLRSCPTQSHRYFELKGWGLPGFLSVRQFSCLTHGWLASPGLVPKSNTTQQKTDDVENDGSAKIMTSLQEQTQKLEESMSTRVERQLVELLRRTGG